ncbi:MAG TPA: restriction endonuclease subunit M [Candidatus Acetothermia bacterium]|nr:restriction endonuclease subunit M [Candidatus Acetothermia bacterium]
MPLPGEVRRLVARFHENRASYVSGPYNETQTRIEFVDPLFTALGWDVANISGYAEAYKDVVHEDAIVIGGLTKAPDYSFRVGGARKFFVETKRPGVKIKDDAGAAFQLRRYAWSAKLPLSILTNFAEFAVYDCRVKPERTDPASTARILYVTCDEYDVRWDELAGIFGKEAVLKGSFDRYAESTKAKRGTAEVDDAFLAEIEGWREELARNLALRNPGLTQRELNFAVQRTIDRIIFLRICEDRGIEPYGGLQALLNGANVYRRLGELFRRADERYNSGLFHFRPEKGRAEPPDELTLDLVVDDKVLKDILRRLYYPESPYEFSVLPADILGQVYEQFLGKVIRLTAGHRAVVEEKPEVRKAGGVYYTPTYIVDYIVEHTVGVLLEGKTPQEVGGFTKAWKRSAKLRPLRVLDPACGSGSFLLGAYQYLLDWYRKKYVEDGPEKHARGRNPRLYRGPGGEWRLTTAERKRILLTHIYGVDIDPQAVEVTKLSLLLKVLEGETHETLDSFYRLFQERALPDLGANIKCGNSLIGPDFWEGKEYTLLDEEERYRINPFDWNAEFPDVFSGQNPGFDVVIGNPPYARIQTLRDSHGKELPYLAAAFRSAARRYDLYMLFIERGFCLLNPGGVLGYICPHKFISADAGSGLRGFLASSAGRVRLLSFGSRSVFSSATTYTGLLFVGRQGDGTLDFVELMGDEPTALNQINMSDCAAYELSSLSNSPWLLLNKPDRQLLKKMNRMGTALGEVMEKILVGVQSGVDAVHIVEFKR